MDSWVSAGNQIHAGRPRPVASAAELGSAALEQLVGGPAAGETGLKGVIPATARVQRLSMEGNTAVVDFSTDLAQAEKLDVDYLLLDTYVKGQYGGSGTGFDKALIPKLTKPYFLAGGLDAENVNENISRCNSFAVDVSSAVETDGVKDETKIEEFIERVRNHE